MIAFASDARVWLVTGHTDMRNYAEHKIMRSPQRRFEFSVFVSQGLAGSIPKRRSA
jgi:hypothetical protein